jgi:hypothetical protein
MVYWVFPSAFMSAARNIPREDFLQDSEIREQIQDILYPYLSTKEPVIAIQFGVAPGKEQDWREAIGFASAYTSYSEKKVGALVKHRVEFSPNQAWDIHQMYQMLEKSPHLEIFINNMRMPYAATLWLPLLWFYL